MWEIIMNRERQEIPKQKHSLLQQEVPDALPTYSRF